MTADGHDFADEAAPTDIATLANGRAMRLSGAGGLLAGVLSGLSIMSGHPLLIVGCVALGIVGIWLYAARLARRRAFTKAVENLKPIERFDDDTLFPEEIDPYKARATWGDVLEMAWIGWLAGFVAFAAAAILLSTTLA